MVSPLVAARLLAISLAAPTAALAQSIEITGDTNSGEIWNRPSGFSTLSVAGSAVRYVVHLITIVDVPAFSVLVPAIGHPDPYIFLYNAAFDAAQPFANLAALDDDSGPGYLDALIVGEGSSLTEGQYTLVVTAFANGQDGAYTIYLDGAAVGWGLASGDQLKELQAMSGQAGRQALRVLTGNITSALAEGQATRALSFSSKGTGAATDMFLWARLSGSDASGDQHSLSLPMLQVGADWTVAPGIVAGLSLSASQFNASSTEASLQASQVAVQPYLGWASGNWHGTASVVLGRIDYDALVTSGGTASAKGDLQAATLELAHDFALPDGARIAPFAALNLGQITLTQTDGSLASTGIDSSIWFNEARLGATYARALGTGTAQVSLSADHFATNAPIDLASGTFDQTGWSGTLGLGYEASVGAGITLNGTARLGGIGTGTRTGDVAVTMRWAF